MTLHMLGLRECSHFLCNPHGSGGERLSGGQLRRVGIGIELVADPPIMLLDEPTSALDAVNTRLVAKALKDLAKRGVLVIASLHQPRSSVYDLLDRVLVMRKGELIYGGSRTSAVDYFQSLGYELSPSMNPADFFIEVAFGFEESSMSLAECASGHEQHQTEPQLASQSSIEEEGVELEVGSGTKSVVIQHLRNEAIRRLQLRLPQATRSSLEQALEASMLPEAEASIAEGTDEGDAAASVNKHSHVDVGELEVKINKVKGARESVEHLLRRATSGNSGREHAVHSGRAYVLLLTPNVSIQAARELWTRKHCLPFFRRIQRLAGDVEDEERPPPTPQSLHTQHWSDDMKSSTERKVLAMDLAYMWRQYYRPGQRTVTSWMEALAVRQSEAEFRRLATMDLADLRWRQMASRAREKVRGTTAADASTLPSGEESTLRAEGFGVTREEFLTWFKSPEGFNGGIREELADEVWKRGHEIASAKRIALPVVKILAGASSSGETIDSGESTRENTKRARRPSREHRSDVRFGNPGSMLPTRKLPTRKDTQSQSTVGLAGNPSSEMQPTRKNAQWRKVRLSRRVRSKPLIERLTNPSWTTLRFLMATQDNPLGEAPSLHQQLMGCTKRYLMGKLRTRVSHYVFLFAGLAMGFLCGALHGNSPSVTERAIFYVLFNSVFATTAATGAITTLTHDGIAGLLFKHEAAHGVNQVAEATARIFIDLIVYLTPLALLFAVPLSAMTNLMPMGRMIGMYWCIAYASSPLGYTINLLAPKSAVVFTSCITLILNAFFNGVFGFPLSSVSSDTGKMAFAWLSPGYSGLMLLAYGSADQLPQSTDAAYLIKSYQKFEVVSKANDAGFVAPFPADNADDWFGHACLRLLVFGTVLRIISMVQFCEVYTDIKRVVKSKLELSAFRARARALSLAASNASRGITTTSSSPYESRPVAVEASSA